MKNITINGATYGFTTNFKHDSQTRSSFNALTRSIFDEHRLMFPLLSHA